MGTAVGRDPVKDVAKGQKKPSARPGPQARWPPGGLQGERWVQFLHRPAEGAAPLLTARLSWGAGVLWSPWPPSPTLGSAVSPLSCWPPESLDRHGSLSSDLQEMEFAGAVLFLFQRL